MSKTTIEEIENVDDILPGQPTKFLGGKTAPLSILQRA
jgi:hypothetical protein